MSGLVPLGRYLIAGDARVEGGVFIPDLESRTQELPARETTIQVVGPDAAETVAWLNAHERPAEVCSLPVELGAEPRPRWRLWSPKRWLDDATRDLPPGRAIDLGCGSGREALLLASRGWKVTGIDHLESALDKARDLEARYGAGKAVEWCHGDAVQAQGSYEAVVALRFYLPALIELIPKLLTIGGHAFLETFTEARRERTGSPRSTDFILPIAEATAWTGMKVLWMEEDADVRRWHLQRVDSV